MLDKLLNLKAFSNDPKYPTFETKVYRDMMDELQVNRDVIQGTEHMRGLNTKYLPKAPKEDRKDYYNRLERSVLFPGLSLTIEGLAGMVFRVDPTLEDDVSVTIQDHWENIDYAGSHGVVFLKDLFKDALNAGHAGIFVDAPDAGMEPMSVAQERAAGIRPYWKHILKEDILNWRYALVNGELVLTQLTLREFIPLEDGAFGEDIVPVYRVYRLAAQGISWDRWEHPKGKEAEAPVLVASGIISKQERIPFAPVYSNKTGFLTSRPPLHDLAWTNVTHWQVKSDHLHALHKASVPILVISGMAPPDGTEVTIGTNTVLVIPEPQASASYIEHSGASIGATRQELQDLKGDMAAQGLAMLQVETRAAETAEAKRIDKAEQDSKLATAARALQDAVEMALGFHAAYLGEDGGSINVNREFEDTSLSTDAARLLVEMVKNGQMTLKTMYEILQDRGGVPADLDIEEEIAALEQEKEARRAVALAIGGGGNGGVDPQQPGDGNGGGAPGADAEGGPGGNQPQNA